MFFILLKNFVFEFITGQILFGLLYLMVLKVKAVEFEEYYAAKQMVMGVGIDLSFGIVCMQKGSVTV